MAEYVRACIYNNSIVFCGGVHILATNYLFHFIYLIHYCDIKSTYLVSWIILLKGSIDETN